jgi:HSP20 family protein
VLPPNPLFITSRVTDDFTGSLANQSKHFRQAFFIMQYILVSQNSLHGTAFPFLKYHSSLLLAMSASEKTNMERKKEESRRFLPITRHMDEIFDDFRRDMENMFHSWPYSIADWRVPHDGDARLPACDMVDKGDKYELQLEIPGIDKDKLDVKATKNSVEISAEESEKVEEKRKNYLYNERSYRSFHRRIPVPEEILPSKIDAKMNNGILQIQLPKKTPTTPEEEAIKVHIK